MVLFLHLQSCVCVYARACMRACTHVCVRACAFSPYEEKCDSLFYHTQLLSPSRLDAVLLLLLVSTGNIPEISCVLFIKSSMSLLYWTGLCFCNLLFSLFLWQHSRTSFLICRKNSINIMAMKKEHWKKHYRISVTYSVGCLYLICTKYKAITKIFMKYLIQPNMNKYYSSVT